VQNFATPREHVNGRLQALYDKIGLIARAFIHYTEALPLVLSVGDASRSLSAVRSWCYNRSRLSPARRLKTHGILDIQPVSLGSVVRPFTADDDLLDKMREGRP
jgi:hypothetical protein